MEDGINVELEYGDNELVGLNLENIIESCQKGYYSTVPIENLSKVHRVFPSF